MVVRAEVIAIGDELTSGQRLDTNSQWISQQLGGLGLRVLYHTTVADNLQANVDVFRLAAARADVVVATGGLGPTADDLTRQAMAEAFDLPLERDDAALAHIQSLFARRQRPMPERNEIQAMFPAGSRVVHNPHGSAPGIDLEVEFQGNACRLIALPGVPAEMKEMWEESVGNLIATHVGAAARVIRHKIIKCFGIGESDLEKMLPDLIRRGRQPQVGITVSKATITLRITAEGESETVCQEQIDPTESTIHDCLGSLVFGAGDDELQHAVVRQLEDRDLSLATVEWGTQGLLTQWLGDVPSQQYRGGVVLRDDDLITRRWQIEALDSAGLVEQMAEQVRDRFSTDLGLAVGPLPNRANADPPEKIWFGLATAKGSHSRSAVYSGHPDILLARAAKQALNFLRLTM